MIDGVKILCNTPPSVWTNNPRLSFRSLVDTKTKEALHNNKHANTNGLFLSIIEGQGVTYCNLRGSVHKYYNNGETNATDYKINDFITTTQLLNNNLSVKPENATLRGFEFGVNIELPFDISHIYEAVKAYKKHIFGINEIRGRRNGIRADFQQYKIKIYDKGQQEKGKKSRLMRFEVVVKKMAFVKHLGIKTLADLQNPAVWVELSKILLEVWEDIIFIDTFLNYKQMTNHKQKKYLRFFDTHYWANLNKNVYHKSKKELEKMQSLYGGEINQKQVVRSLLYAKLQTLSGGILPKIGDILTTKKVAEITENLPPLENENWRHFNHSDKELIQVIRNNNILNKENNNIKKKKPKKSCCMNCNKSLKDKKASAKFCGLRCKNQYNGHKRTLQRQKKRIQEIKALEKLLPKIKKGALWLSITYKDEGAYFSDILHQSEILPPPEEIRKIRAVSVSLSEDIDTPDHLTTIRAKKLIRIIAHLNRLKI